jgi:hypothetical protein
MNKTLSTTLIVAAILVLAGGIFFAGAMYARSNMMFGWSNNNTYGPGMMNGMITGNGGMMNGYGNRAADFTPLTIDQAKVAAQKYLENIKDSNLTVGEVMIFDNNAYVVVKEVNTGLGAFELLVDPTTQIAYPEHGPNMMWNLKYSGLNHQFMIRNSGGMMGGNGGMMGGYNWDSTTLVDVSAEMAVTSEQAIEYAHKYLDTNISGVQAATDPTQFYGYYTLDFEKDGKVAGMLSVNGYSGQVFLHTWHGTFIEETE